MNQKLKHFLDNSNFRKDRRGKKSAVGVSKKKESGEQEEILTIKDGQIIINEANMYIDAHKHVDMEVMEDDRIVTSSTFSKRRGGLRWSTREVDLFYKALEICGIEFSLISSLFPHKERKHIKAKYLKETRDNPSRIDEVLSQHKTFDQGAFNELRRYLD